MAIDTFRSVDGIRSFKPSEAKGTEVYIKDSDGIWIELLD